MWLSGRYIIDGVDIWSAYGVVVVEGGYDQIFELPNVKQPDSYDWAEFDYSEVDFSNPALEPQRYSVKFGTVKGQAGVDGMLDLLLNGKKHDVIFNEINYKSSEVFCTRVTAEEFGNLRLFTADFIESVNAPNLGVLEERKGTDTLEINGVHISELGAIVLSAPIDALISEQATKKQVVYESRYKHGYKVLHSPKSKDNSSIMIRLMLEGDGFNGLWRNRNNLIASLLAGTNYRDSSREISAYYKSSSVGQFFYSEISPKVELSINLELTT